MYIGYKMNFFSILLFVFRYSCDGLSIPDNYSGSTEVFSGYLPDKETFVEAFSYHDDCTVFEGQATSISKDFFKAKPEGK